MVVQVRVRCHVEYIDVEGRADREAVVNVLEVRPAVSFRASYFVCVCFVCQPLPLVTSVLQTRDTLSERVRWHHDPRAWIGKGDGDVEGEVFYFL